MMNESKSNNTNLSLDALKGMQSVRATFTLPRTTINLLSTVANQLGIKQKSIFDHLVEDKQTLDQIAGKARKYQPQKNQRKQKTFVLSKNSLSRLDAFAREYELPRDVLVEFSIRQLRPVIAQEKQKHENRKRLFEEMEGFCETAGLLLDKARQLIGEDDEFFCKLEYILDLYNKHLEDLNLAIEKGKPVEEFQS